MPILKPPKAYWVTANDKEQTCQRCGCNRFYVSVLQDKPLWDTGKSYLIPNLIPKVYSYECIVCGELLETELDAEVVAFTWDDRF